MKKLLIVISCLGVGGGERSLVNLLNEFDFMKYEIDLLTLNDSGLLGKQIPKKVNVIIKDTKLNYLYNNFCIKDVFKKNVLKTVLFRIIATFISRKKEKNINRSKQYRWEHFYKHYLDNCQGKYDAVFAYMNDDAMYYVADKVNSNNKIAWIHNDYYAMGYDAEMDRQYFSIFSKIVTISNECLHILQEIFPEFASKCVMIPNLTSEKVVKKRATEFYPEEFISINTFKLLSIGRLSEQKGYDLAIAAAKILKNKGIDFRWFVLGDGELRGKLEMQITKAGVTDRFILCGIRQNPYPYLAYCDIFVQTSRFEGKSVALDEAKIFCKPIVATKYSTVYDQLDDKTGVLVDMNEEAIANGIYDLMTSHKRREVLTDNARKENHDNMNMISQYYALIECGGILSVSNQT